MPSISSLQASGPSHKRSGQPVTLEDGRELRNAFATFATGVAIVTTCFGDEMIGATVSSFNSVSLVPPLVSFSIARTARALEAWNATDRFGVSILARAQSELSSRFARSMADKWSGVEIREANVINVPLIGGALMWFECEVYARYDGGDHIILLGRVLAATRNSEAGTDPLLFHGGTYRHLAPPVGSETIPDNAMWPHGW
nr:flavin reductase family protein [Mesorhizobium sp.]